VRSRMSRLGSAPGALAGFVLAAAVLWPSLTGTAAFLPADLWWKSSQPWAAIAPAAVRHFPSNELLGDQVVPYAPQLWVAHESIRSGGQVLWNPYVGCGEPLLGSDLSGPLAPTNLPVLGLAWPDGFAWSALLRFGWMWVGAFLLGRVLGLGRGWAATLGVGFSLAPGLILHFQQPRGAIHRWLPWLLLCVERIPRASRGDARGLLRAALAAPFPVLAMLLGAAAGALVTLAVIPLWTARLPDR